MRIILNLISALHAHEELELHFYKQGLEFDSQFVEATSTHTQKQHQRSRQMNWIHELQSMFSV